MFSRYETGGHQPQAHRAAIDIECSPLQDLYVRVKDPKERLRVLTPFIPQGHQRGRVNLCNGINVPDAPCALTAAVVGKVEEVGVFTPTRTAPAHAPALSSW